MKIIIMLCPYQSMKIMSFTSFNHQINVFSTIASTRIWEHNKEIWIFNQSSTSIKLLHACVLVLVADLRAGLVELNLLYRGIKNIIRAEVKLEINSEVQVKIMMLFGQAGKRGNGTPKDILNDWIEFWLYYTGWYTI